MSQYNISSDNLSSLNFFELRSLARQLGVTIPVGAKADQLIELVNEAIKSGSVDKPSVRKRQPKISVVESPKTTTPSDTSNAASSNLVYPKGRMPRPATKLSDNSAPEYNAKPADKTYEKESDIVSDLEEATVVKAGWLEIYSPENYGFLRAHGNENSAEDDAYVYRKTITKYGLRAGDYVKVRTKPNTDNKVMPAIVVEEINGQPPEAMQNRPLFEDLIPIYPDEMMTLELSNAKNDLAIRSIDLVAPIGKGQRGMIVSPPKAGKTTLLKKIANSIAINHPEIKLFVLLVDERPEEVTDMQRSIKGEVVYSTFDETAEHHTRAAEMLMARCKRLVELNNDVVILMDSLTRLARAYNLTTSPSGKTLSGGIDPTALYQPKRFFGAARNMENGGSLTIIATALVDTGSKMDDIIYEEFKGTGNMEIHLDRKLSEKRIFPAIDLFRSSTRREELLLTPKELDGVYTIRRMLSEGDTQEAAESIIAMMIKTKNNNELIDMVKNQISYLEKEGFKRRV